VFVNGQIRGGRSAERKDALIAQITAAVAEASKLPKRNVWIYISDLVPRLLKTAAGISMRLGYRSPGLGRHAPPK